MPYCAINRHGLVLGVGIDPDGACHDANGLCTERVFRVVPCEPDVVSYFETGNDVMVSVCNCVAVL